jgi:hypothetical protein
MDVSQAVNSLAEELRSHDTDLYVFQPADQEGRFFIGQAFLVGAATIFITAFLKGISTAVEKRAANWGETVGEWMCERLEELFRGRTSPVSENEVKGASAVAGNALARLSDTQRAKLLSEVQESIALVLERRGVAEKVTSIVVTRVREEALGLAGS